MSISSEETGTAATRDAVLALVVPCYNEAARLDVDALRRAAAARPDVRFLLVNDGSTDSTASILTALAQENPRSFSALLLSPNMGKAEAVRRGTQAALESNVAFVGYWDADFSTPLDEMDRFLEVLRTDPRIIAVLGARIRRLGADIQRSAVRHYLGRLFATAASVVLELPTYDTQCGAKIFRVCPAIVAAFSRPFVSAWIFDVEVIARVRMELRRGGMSDPIPAFFELPLAAWRDVEGSKLKPRHMLIALLDLWKIRRLYSRPVAH